MVFLPGLLPLLGRGVVCTLGIEAVKSAAVWAGFLLRTGLSDMVLALSAKTETAAAVWLTSG